MTEINIRYDYLPQYSSCISISMVIKSFWDFTKSDLMAMFADFQRNELPLFHLNFGTIVLLPKKKMLFG
jgi:hypothetical protein